MGAFTIRGASNMALKLLGHLDWVPGLLTRLVVGFAFYDSGNGKLSNPENTVNFFTDLGIPFPELNAAFVSRLEYYGGMLLLVGALTRIVALLLSSTMIDVGVGGLAEELHPGPLHARVVGGCLHQVQEVGDGVVEPCPQPFVSDVAAVVERVVRLGQGEHVGVDACTEVFERDAQRPQATVTAHHRR